MNKKRILIGIIILLSVLIGILVAIKLLNKSNNDLSYTKEKDFDF